MAINRDDGQFCLDCWIDPSSDAEPDDEVFSDNLDELKDEAQKLIDGGKFKYFRLASWDDAKDEWATVEEFTPG